MTITNISLLADRALLSQATYAKTVYGMSDGEVQAALREDAKLTATQRTNFNAKFQFVTTRPNELNGFSATVYRDRATNQLIFATRGTEIEVSPEAIKDLFAADIAGIGGFGYANFQAASMYRYWKRLTTVGDAPVQYTDSELSKLFAIQYGVATPAIQASPAYLAFQLDVRTDKGLVAGQPAGTALIAPNTKVDVVGHSLGGHLATTPAE